MHPKANLSEETVEVLEILEGGTLFDQAGDVVYPSSSPASPSFLVGSESDNINTRYDPVEYGVMSAFLANDAWYSENFENMRYENFMLWEETAPFATLLVHRSPDMPNCMLLSSAEWKKRTRYELSVRISHQESAAFADHPVWMAPLIYETPPQDNIDVGGPIRDDDLRVDMPAMTHLTPFSYISMSVRGNKDGAVCRPPMVHNESDVDCTNPGFVRSPRGHCVHCPRLDDMVRDDQCQVNTDKRWASWTNNGLGTENECCPSATFSQLVGNEACGALISPRYDEIDINHLDFGAELAERMCQQYTTIKDIFERSYCDLTCVQTGYTQPPCACELDPLLNMTHVNDAYMARSLLRDFAWDARSLVDSYSLNRAFRLLRERQLDRDHRRTWNPTRRYGLEGVWNGDKTDMGRFYDWYNVYIEFQPAVDPTEAGLQDEEGSVAEHDTLFAAYLNLRAIGLMLADGLLTAYPKVCPGVFDPFSDVSTDPILVPVSDPYWPIHGHPVNEF